MRQDAIKQAEKERRDKYKKQEDERENIRQNIRDKVSEALQQIVKDFYELNQDPIPLTADTEYCLPPFIINGHQTFDYYAKADLWNADTLLLYLKKDGFEVVRS